MANPDAPFGFLPTRNLNGAPWSGGTMLCSLASDYDVAMFIGDCVLLIGDADAKTGYGEPNQGLVVPEVNKAVTASTHILGSIVGFVPNYSDLSLKHNVASTQRQCIVALAGENVVFTAQDDGGDTPDGGLTQVGQAWDISTDNTAGSTATGYSGQELDTEDSSEDHWYVIRPAPKLDNDPGQDNTIWEVVCGNFSLASQIGVPV